MLLHSNADIAVSGRYETIAIDIKRDEELQGRGVSWEVQGSGCALLPV